MKEKLLNLRQAKKVTQQVVADYVGISRATYAQYEAGTRSPGRNVLQKLADYYDVTTDYILGRTDDSRRIDDLLVFESKTSSEDVDPEEKISEKEDAPFDAKEAIRKVLIEQGLSPDRPVTEEEHKRILRVIAAVAEEFKE